MFGFAVLNVVLCLCVNVKIIVVMLLFWMFSGSKPASASMLAETSWAAGLGQGAS